MWCTMWCMKRTNIYLDEEQTAALDQLAEQEHVSRAELIRQLLDRVLANADASLVSDLHAIEDSFGALQAIIDVPKRGQSGREDHLARIWRRSS
jgi:metal-responsive CopG/Arc/MetJ family transcriptional regulator